MNNLAVGIEDFGLYMPKKFLPIEVLANLRNIEYAKLNLGLGLQEMAVCEPHEQVAFMAAAAIIDLVENAIKTNKYADAHSFLKEIDRLYLGTESAIDAAKPSITYALEFLEAKYPGQFGHIDMLDMTFACIGGVDAMQQCTDYVRLRPQRRCIIISADAAVYDAHTGGEYTQGAGAIALLIAANPALVSFNGETGVSIHHDFDFYKPKRYFSKIDIAQELFSKLGIEIPKEMDLSSALAATQIPVQGTLEGWPSHFWEIPGSHIPVSRNEPVYDGQFSNACFEQRVADAAENFLHKEGLSNLTSFEQWIFHLPYAYQGRRMAVSLWWHYIAKQDPFLKYKTEEAFGKIPEDHSMELAKWYKGMAKSDAYKSFVQRCIAPSDRVSSRVGNLYTSSIFMALLSGIAYAENELSGKSVLFLAYGSGSKSKVFRGKYGTPEALSKVKARLESHLNARTALTADAYVALRKGFGES